MYIPPIVIRLLNCNFPRQWFGKTRHCRGILLVFLMWIDSFSSGLVKAVFQIYSSHSFLMLQAFFSIMFTIARSTPLIFLAWCGHWVTHRMHEMHSFLSTFLGLFISMAPTGHCAAQVPHLLHDLRALGTTPALSAFRYGRLPGIRGVEKSFRLSLSPICLAKLRRCA